MVGWSLRPSLCGRGIGQNFVTKCIMELVKLKKYYMKDILLKVYSWNTRAIKTYEKAGFVECDKLVRVEDGKTTEYSLMKMNIE